MKFTKITLQTKLWNSRADVLNVEFLFVKYIVPLGNNIPDWLKLTAEGRLKKLTKYLKAQIICRKFVVEFVLKIGFVKEIV